MKPSQLASQLRRIAAGIDNSKKPDRQLVARDLKKIIASLRNSGDASSGDPNQPGGYSLTMKVMEQKAPDGATVVFVKGVISGKLISGAMWIHLNEDGSFKGYDWKNGRNLLQGGKLTPTFDITGDDMMLQVVLDTVNDELGLN